MPDEIDERMVREAFWSNVICTQKTKRLVAKAPDLKDSTGGSSGQIQIFVPQGPDDDFDLVLSLCEDGTQRLTVDWDQSPNYPPHLVLSTYAIKVREMGPHRSRIITVTPSTSNWHLWGDAKVEWATVTQALALVGNVGYYTMNQHKGYCTLRPPWKNKNQMSFHDAIGMRFNRKPDKDMFAGFDWSKISETEPEPEGTGWDELGWDDE